MLRMSTLFLRTLREDPADAEVPSHRLLVRGGYVRRVAPGIYSWLPLGLKVLNKVAGVVREFDEQAVRLIWVETPPPGAEWEGVRDRLQRASAG